VRGARRCLLQGRDDHLFDLVQVDQRWPAGTLFVDQPIETLGQEPPTPLTHSGQMYVQGPCHVSVRVALGTRQDDPGPHRENLCGRRSPRPTSQRRSLYMAPLLGPCRGRRDDKIVDAQPDTDAETTVDNKIIAECDRKLSTYRATLDAGGDPNAIGEWINQTQADKSLAEARIRQRGTDLKRLSREQMEYIVTTLTDLTQVIHDADPRDKAEIYRQLGLRLTYQPEKAAVLVEARPTPVGIRFVSGAQQERYSHVDRSWRTPGPRIGRDAAGTASA
jgi:hypothetical protein